MDITGLSKQIKSGHVAPVYVVLGVQQALQHQALTEF